MSSYKVWAITLGLLLILSTTLVNAGAQYVEEHPVSVRVATDKSSYSPGENVFVKVAVEPVKPDSAIVIDVLSPDEYQWAQVKIFPNKDGIATHTFTLSRDASAGSWRIYATYLDAKAEVSFSVSKVAVEPAPAPVPMPAELGGIIGKVSCKGDLIAGASVFVSGPSPLTVIAWEGVTDRTGAFDTGLRLKPGEYTVSLSHAKIIWSAAMLTVKSGQYARVDMSDCKVREEAPAPVPVPAPAAWIKVTTDKTSYTIRETVLIRAQVDTMETPESVGPASTTSREPVIITIIGSDGKSYLRKDFLPNDRGAVEVKFDIGEGYPRGTWTILASYRGAEVKASFTVAGAKEAPIPIPKMSPSGYMWTQDKKQYAPGDTVFVKGKGPVPLSPDGMSWTAIVLDPDEEIYLEKEVKAESDGSISLQFELAKDVKPGRWSIQIVSGDTIDEVEFEVIGGEKAAGVALIKNLKKTTLILVKNTGDIPIGELRIKVDDGSISFVKAKNWDRKRISDNEVVLTSIKDLEPNESTLVIMKWKDRPDLPREMKLPLTSCIVLSPSTHATESSTQYGCMAVILFTSSPSVSERSGSS